MTASRKEYLKNVVTKCTMYKNMSTRFTLALNKILHSIDHIPDTIT